MCLIASVETPKALALVEAQLATWVPHACDNVLFYSNHSDPDKFVEHVFHDGPESHDNMWRKLRSALLFLHNHYDACLAPFDWFFLADADTFVIPSNFRRVLDEYQGVGATPVFLGRPLKIPTGAKLEFNSGGAGMVLNRLALDHLFRAFARDSCTVNHVSAPLDTVLAECLLSQSILPADTRDANARHRFHMLSPYGHLLLSQDRNGKGDWVHDYSIFLGPIRYGLDYFSPSSATFHYMSPPAMLFFHHLLHP